MNELKIQRQFIVSCKNAGGDGFKTSNRFLMGVSDLYLMLAPLPHLWLELKYADHMPQSGLVKIDLTPHQRQFIHRIKSQGGMATVAVVVSCGHGEYQVGVVPHKNIYTIDKYQFPGIIKASGEDWPIREIMERATCS